MSDNVRSLFISDANAALATDLYQLTMAAAYFENRCHQTSTFELFVRKLPPNRSFLVAAGLEQALHYLKTFHFDEKNIKFLRAHPMFKNVSDSFFHFLKRLRFSGDVWAVPEGTLVFAEEPLLRVSAPIIEAQLVETYLLSTLNFQTTIASKAARVCLAAGGRDIVEFGSRRAHGPQAAVLAARAAFIGGCVGTSNVLAGCELGIPIYGTMAHSFIMSFADETEAFLKYQTCFPENTIILVDTYDTIEGVKKAIAMGAAFQGVRLDSGNLLLLSRKVRKLLDAAGRNHVKIMASGDLNEEIIHKLISQRAPIDVFGVGTELAVSKDQPALSGIYKLVAQREGARWVGKAKYSEKKTTDPGSKQVYRITGKDGKFTGDIISLDEEPAPPRSKPLLVKVMRRGEIVVDPPDVRELRATTRRQLEQLPERYKSLFKVGRYPVRKSARLEDLRKDVMREQEMAYKPAPR